MYCKNCGAQNSKDAKFCTSCGNKIEQETSSSYEEEQSDFYDNYEQENLNQEQYDNRPSNIYGAQFQTQTSDTVPFINRRHNLTRIIGFAFIFAIALLAFFLFFGDGGVIYDVQIGAEVNSETYYPDEPLEYVIESSGVLYISYSAADIQYETIEVQIYYLDTNQLLYTEDIYISYEDQVGYFSYDHDWVVGEYVILFLLNEEEVYQYNFDVLYD